MSLSLSTALRAGLVLAAASLALPAYAGTVYQSATATANPQGGFAIEGDGTSDNSRFIGAAFEVLQPTLVSDIGGNFRNSRGSIFGEIIALSGLNSFPSVAAGDLESIALGHIVISPAQDGDASGALSVMLEPGTYGVLFGSGLFGATGTSSLTFGNDDVGSPTLFENNFDLGYDVFPADGIRIFVDGQVPEPATLALLGFGVASLFSLRRRA